MIATGRVGRVSSAQGGGRGVFPQMAIGHGQGVPDVFTNTILRHHAPGFPRPPQAVFCLRLFNILPTHSLELPCQLLSPFLEALCIVSCIETIVSLSHRVQADRLSDLDATVQQESHSARRRGL